MTADGWRARKQGGIVYQFVYDPQGSVQQRHTDGSYTGGFAAYDRSTFEGYGALRQANKGSTGAIVGQHDPAGFGGQFGYYTDTETGLLCLTHRYYDPGTGKFINRDPIGYGGGANLYGFCAGNPVNASDPNGTASCPYKLKPNQVYIELDAFIPDPWVMFDAGEAMGDNRGASSTNASCRYYEAAIIDTKAKTIEYLGGGTGDTRVFTFTGQDVTGNSAQSGYASFEGSASIDRIGNYHIHFNANASIGYGLGWRPSIAGAVNITLNKYGDLVSKGVTGSHTAFPGFEVWHYGGGENPALLYAWDPHHNFDPASHPHSNYMPMGGLNTKVGVKGNWRGVLYHSAYW